MSEVMLREISIADAKAICAICCNDLDCPCDIALVEKKIKKLNFDREAVYVAVMDDAVVGFIHVEQYDTLFLESMANILGIAVHSEYQHHGVGKVLLQAAEAWAAKKKITAMRLNSGSSRTNAHSFYAHLGYRLEKEQLRFVKTL